MRLVLSSRGAGALAVVACLGVLGLPARPAAATPAGTATGNPATGHFNVGATHSPQLEQALAGARAQVGLVQPAAATSAASSMVQGVDVASYQHPTSKQYPNGAPIDWSQVAGAGYQFAAVKATEGAYYPNPYALTDLADAKAAGLSVAAYAFAIPNGNGSSSSPVTQADYLLSYLGAGSSTIPIMLDIEYNPYPNAQGQTNACYWLTPAAMVSWISAFDTEIQSKTGQLPIIYTTQGWWSTCTGGSTAFGHSPMWVAAYSATTSPALPAGWGNWGFWQYASTGTVPGIATTTATDLDALNLASPGDKQGNVGQAIAPLRVDQYNAPYPPGLAYSAKGLPAGLSMDSTGQISGTPTTAGVSAVSVTAKTSSGVTGSVSFSWNVGGAITVSSPGTQSTVAGSPVDLRIQAVDSTAGQTPAFSATGLPPGVSISASGLITGWPARAGTYPVTVKATDTAGDAGSASFTWTVGAAPDSGPAGPVRLDLGGKCLDDTGNSSNNGTRIQIWSCNGGSSQHWTMVQDTTVRIHGKCLDIVNLGTTNGSAVDLWTCTGGTNQQWQIGTDGELVNPVSGKCLDDTGWSTTNGTKTEIWSCTGGANQKWTTPAGPLVSQIPGKCVDDHGFGTANGTVIDLWSCNGGSNQNWIVEPDGTVRIYGKCLQVAGAGTAAGTPLQLWTCNGGSSEHWRINLTGQVLNPVSGLCLADPADSTTNGTRLTIQACASPPDPGTTWRAR